MSEATNLMLGLSILLSLFAAASWMRVSHARQLQHLTGRKTPQGGDSEVAFQLLFLTVIASALAAAFGVTGWLSST